ncbi:MAG TPA: bile acid:sodium symporter family protein [Wenzhouxiangellaceae bacterium]|nr:bile acid:sodium symporter family protein [Wenzhouxiangellaceae bacterium]
MTADWLAQSMLPWILAAVMLAMGLSLEAGNFRRVARHPGRLILGLALQMLALPLLSWAVVLVLPLSPLAAAGLLLVALVPGGATSNLFTYLVRGDLALSVCLTAVTAMLVPFTLPLIMALNFRLLGLSAAEFSLPYWTVVGQLVLVTLAPALAGMGVRRLLGSRHADALLPAIRRLTGIAMISIVLALFAAYFDRLPAFASLETVAVLVLCCMAMLLGDRVARRAGLPDASVRSVTVEVGVQNAGVAMMVAFAILENPVLGVVPLLYGLMMNVPAFGWVFWHVRRIRSNPPEGEVGEICDSFE